MKYILVATLMWSLSANASLTFTEDVRPVFQKSCTKCHNANTKLPNFLKYEVAYSLRYSIKEKLEKREMPHIGYLSESERETILDWIRQGAKK